MDARPSGLAAAWAGILAGIAGLATFLMVHHAWIVPIWFIVPAGTLIAAAGGAVVGLGYAELRPHLPGRPWTAGVMLAMVGAMLLPAVAIAQLRGPILQMAPGGGATLLVPIGQAIVDFALGLVGSAALVGALLGWLVGRTRRVMARTAAAAAALALGPGHNIPLLGGTPAVVKELVILLLVGIVASTVLVVAEALLRRATASRPYRA
jgi:hypothetical protein